MSQELASRFDSTPVIQTNSKHTISQKAEPQPIVQSLVIDPNVANLNQATTGSNRQALNTAQDQQQFGQTLTSHQPVYYESDKPDFRQPDFEDLALILPLDIFKALVMRDDLTCQSEAQVLSLIEKYILRQPQETMDSVKNELLPCIRLDKLPSDRLIQLNKNPAGIFQGYQ